MISIHIAAGILALAAGFVALAATKGSPTHRKSGMVFFGAIVVMTCTAVFIATFLRPQRLNVVAGLTTFYLVCSGVLTIRRQVHEARRWFAALMLLALGTSAYAASLGLGAIAGGTGRVDGIPVAPLLVFATVALIGGLLDARLLLAGAIEGSHRLARHIWRMGFALWIATASAFLGQARHFPDAIRSSGLLAIPVILVLVMVLYWLVRVLWKGYGTARLSTLPTPTP